MLSGIFLDNRSIGLYFFTDRKNFRIVVIPGEQDTGKAHYHEDDNQNQYCPAACGKQRNELCRGLGNCFGSSGRVFRCFSCCQSRTVAIIRSFAKKDLPEPGMPSSIMDWFRRLFMLQRIKLWDTAFSPI